MSIVHPTILPQTSSGNEPVIDTIPRIAYDDFFGMIELSHIGISFRKHAREPIDTTHIITAFGLILQSSATNWILTPLKRQSASRLWKS